MSSKLIVAVIGATGLIGREMLKILEERNFPATEVRAIASSRSIGAKISYKGKTLTVQELTGDSFADVSLALFSAGSSTAERFAPHAVKAGCVAIDNSSAWRMDEHCPLIVPEVNADALADHHGIIANPNCTTIQLAVVLKPLHDVGKITRVVVSTYQAVSGTGQKAIDELDFQVRELLNMREPVAKVYPHTIAFNILPHIDAFLPNGYTKEEVKIVRETGKIMDDPNIRITATTARVPVFYAHSASVNIETKKKISPQETRDILSRATGVKILDNPDKKLYPMPIFATGQNETFVGRIREDETIANGLNMWIVADNLRKGAALNAVQSAEILLDRNLLRVQGNDREMFFTG